jgi:predicted RNA binding protein YcfA (HicA-like mRNA interferase family)
MSKLPIVRPEKLIKFVEYLGFNFARQKGSHMFYKHNDGRTATISFHKGEDIPRGLLVKILRDIEIDKDEFVKWLIKK